MNQFKKLITANALFHLARTFIGGFIIAHLLTKDISLSTISLAKALQLTATTLLTIPIGHLADSKGKKICTVFACLFALVYFLCLLNPNSSRVIVGEIANGISLAFYCGAYEAWIFSFSAKNKEHETFAKSQELSYILMILSGLTGALLSQYALYMSISVMLLALFFFANCTEKKIVSSKVNKKKISDLISIFNHNHYLIFYGAAIILSMSFMQTIYQFWQPFFSEPPFSASNIVLGSIFSCFMLAQYLFSYCNRKFLLDKRLRHEPIYLLIATLVLGLLLHDYGKNLTLSIIEFSLFMAIAATAVNLMFSGYAQLVPSEQHSTAISFIDAGSRLFGAIILWTFALLKIEQITYLWECLAVVLLTTAFVAYLKPKYMGKTARFTQLGESND